MDKKEKQEFFGLIKEYLDEENIIRGNRIIIGDFEVSSTSANLKDVEQTINRLITKHKEFAEMRRQRRTFESSGVFG